MSFALTALLWRWPLNPDGHGVSWPPVFPNFQGKLGLASSQIQGQAALASQAHAHWLLRSQNSTPRGPYASISKCQQFPDLPSLLAVVNFPNI